MKLEDQVCSLELSKKLNHLGVNQESLNYWFKNPISDKWVVGNPSEEWERYSSFSASELLDMLPLYLTLKHDEPFNNFRFYMTRFVRAEKDNNEELNMIPTFIANYECDSTQAVGENVLLFTKLFKNILDESLADCLAKLLIKVVEEGFIKNG